MTAVVSEALTAVGLPATGMHQMQRPHEQLLVWSSTHTDEPRGGCPLLLELRSNSLAVSANGLTGGEYKAKALSALTKCFDATGKHNAQRLTKTEHKTALQQVC
jgi:hypothetical protein